MSVNLWDWNLQAAERLVEASGRTRRRLPSLYDGTPEVGPGLARIGHWWVQC